MKKIFLWIVSLGALAVAIVVLWPAYYGNPSVETSVPVADSTAQIARGRYLAQVSDCMACHTARGGTPFAGGRAIKTAYGTFVTPNITPDVGTGLGSWSTDDFWRAMHLGRSRDGHPLYPVFPYTDYTHITRADADAIYAYLRSIPAASAPSQPHALHFPYDQRWLMYAWQRVYFTPGVYQPNPQQSEAWNRGAYLVNGAGHCGACHTSRNAMGSALSKSALAGGFLVAQDWYAPALDQTPSASRSAAASELATLLRTGTSARHSVYGPMSEVVFGSLQYLTNEDALAIADYLHSLPQSEPPPAPADMAKVSGQYTGELMQRGAQLYHNDCAACHQINGAGVRHIYPALGANASVLAPSPVNAIRMVLNGGFAPATALNPRPFGMPPFSPSYSDSDVAAVVTYMRQSWGNDASAVAPQDVARFRSAPVD